MIYDAEANSYGDVNERCEKLSLAAEDDRDVEILNTLWGEIKQHGMFRVQLITSSNVAEHDELLSLRAEVERLRNVESCHLARTASLATIGNAPPCGTVLVPIPDAVWPGIHDFDPAHPEYGIDAEGRKCLRLDACIVPVVKTLWDAGILTLSCCCGHGSGWGVITVRPSCAPEYKP